MVSARTASAAATSRAPTRSVELRERIEEEIATGRLTPGSRLDEVELAARFSVSRTPVREALIQLTSTGILEMRPRRGAVVPEVAPQRLVEMFEVMAGLEAMCGRLAARRMSDTEHQELLHAHQSCEAAVEGQDADAYYHQNEAFHHTIYTGSHNSFLAEQALALHKRLRPYRRLQLRVRDRMRTSFTEHQRIVDAILAGDSAGAEASLHAHVLVQGEKFTDLIASVYRDATATKPEVRASAARRTAATRPGRRGGRRHRQEARRSRE